LTKKTSTTEKYKDKEVPEKGKARVQETSWLAKVARRADRLK